jgi:hypothetical protein
MDLARKGTLREWRAALPLALCFQQLLRIVECFDLNGSNVVKNDGLVRVTVGVSKNHPKSFTFRVLIKRGRPNCVGVFMADLIKVMGIQLGHPGSFFVCKLAQTGGVLKAAHAEKVTASTIQAACKLLILAAGLNPRSYASHSSKMP